MRDRRKIWYSGGLSGNTSHRQPVLSFGIACTGGDKLFRFEVAPRSVLSAFPTHTTMAKANTPATKASETNVEFPTYQSFREIDGLGYVSNVKVRYTKVFDVVDSEGTVQKFKKLSVALDLTSKAKFDSVEKDLDEYQANGTILSEEELVKWNRGRNFTANIVADYGTEQDFAYEPKKGEYVRVHVGEAPNKDGKMVLVIDHIMPMPEQKQKLRSRAIVGKVTAEIEQA